jgi:hypothetical protein
MAILDYAAGSGGGMRSAPAAIFCASLSALALIVATVFAVRSATLLREVAAARMQSSGPTNWIFAEPHWVRPNWLETNAWAWARRAIVACGFGAFMAIASVRLRPTGRRAWPFLLLVLCNAIFLVTLLLFWFTRGLPEIRSV